MRTQAAQKALLCSRRILISSTGHMRTQAAQKAVPVQFVTAPTQPTSQTEGTKTPQPVTAVTTTASGQQVPIVAAYLPSVDNSTRAENDELKEFS